VCVRYILHEADSAISAVSKALGAKLAAPDWIAPRYNVSIASRMPVVAAGGGGPEVRGMLWGLIPPGAKGEKNPRLLANARAETVATLNVFRRGVERRRCLVPANGFYEWRTEAGAKQPHLFQLRDQQPFAFAGIWEPAGEGRPETYCILTTEPNELVAPIHNRMPVILTGATMSRWIGSEPLGESERGELVRPLAAELMAVVRVSRFVNSTRNEGPECLSAPEGPSQLELGNLMDPGDI
jgi:putative SOS response-associated peptidase YedK